MSENIAAAIAAKNEVIAQQGTSLDEVAAVLETKAAGGTDISLGLTSASVGQTIKVKAVDESGKPTEWESVDMPSGGGHWETVLEKPFDTIDGNTLVNRSGALCVNTTDDAEQDNTRPITSSGVHVICGNINALLQTI